MAVKANAVNIVRQSVKRRQEEVNSKSNGENERKLRRLQDLLHRLLSGKQMSAKDGREFFYEFICNNSAMREEVFTGNSETFKRIGQQEWARDLMEFAKIADIGLYHKMELEAMTRNKEVE